MLAEEGTQRPMIQRARVEVEVKRHEWCVLAVLRNEHMAQDVWEPLRNGSPPFEVRSLSE